MMAYGKASADAAASVLGCIFGVTFLLWLYRPVLHLVGQLILLMLGYLGPPLPLVFTLRSQRISARPSLP